MFRQICFLCVLILLSGAAFAQIQTPDSAINYFERGTKKYNQGDVDGAIKDFSQAIEISSHPAFSKPHSNRSPGANAFSDSVDEAANINIIDPFTAHALTSRGL